ncbi:nucleotidyltransferase family protein [Paenibacillus sp. FJAT-27812]|uniref:nucleotidyltransferase family protein n=1 Tax=Paenibacillus sp. FJAT-27812 TaxID=1684143 RepID=UPI0006A774A8|nr:nucleotidyltransferase family protein [Paenibacillus sp. FJAT-27812]
MSIHNEEDIIRLVREDKWMMEVLSAAKMLQLPDWWVCAGFIRSKIWDVLHGYPQRTATPDVDVIYFDASNLDEAVEKKLEAELRALNPTVPWSVKNEARMHLIDHALPYTSSVDAISKFPETATALGLTLNHHNNVILAAPCGIDDVIHMEVKPTPFFAGSNEKMKHYESRIANKNWQQIWPLVRIVEPERSNRFE